MECMIFYTADFGDEMSDGEHAALIGESFDRQLKWTSEIVIPWILNKHSGKLTIVGHSMGGVIGRMAIVKREKERRKERGRKEKREKRHERENENLNNDNNNDKSIHGNRIKVIEVAAPRKDLMLILDSRIRDILNSNIIANDDNDNDNSNSSSTTTIISPGKNIYSFYTC